MVFSFDPAPDLETTATHRILDLICESCLYLCPGTCLPSRSNRMFPVAVWPATTLVLHWWSPILSSVSSWGLVSHLAQETKELIELMTVFEDKLCFLHTELIIKHCHTAHCTPLQIDYVCVAMDTFRCLNIILQDCLRTTVHIMVPQNTEHVPYLTWWTLDVQKYMLC